MLANGEHSGEDRAAVRGAVLHGLRRWAIATYGQEAFDAMVAMMPDEVRPVWEARVLNHTQRYPAAVFASFGAGVLEHLAKGDLQSLRDAGTYVAFQDLSGFMRFLLRVGSPSLIVSRFPRAWDTYFDMGRLVVAERDGNRAIVEIFGSRPLGPLAQQGPLGWMVTALEYGGTKAVQASVEARASCDRYTLHWGP